MRGIVVAAAVLAAVTVSEGRAAAYLDEAAWHNAVLDLNTTLLAEGRTLRYVPIALRFVNAEDGFGTYTDFYERVFYATAYDRPPSEWGPRFYAPPTSTWSGGFFASLGCDSAAYPCLGAWAMTFAFDQPVYGFGGALDYRLGSSGMFLPDSGAGIVPFDAVNQAVWDGRLGNPEHYSGFFGLLTPEAMTELRLTFFEGRSVDTTAGVMMEGYMLVAVPVREPPALPLVASALALLLLAGTARQRLPATRAARGPLTRV